MKKLLMALLLICCTVLSSQPAWATGDINYDNIKLLYVGPFVSFDAKLGHRVVENVPRYIFPLMSQRPFIRWKAYLHS